MREEGHYWVLWGANSQYPSWVVGEWDGQHWTFCGQEYLYTKKEMAEHHRIGERIIPPQ